MPMKMADEKPSKKKKKKKNGADQDQMVPQPSGPGNRAMIAQNPFDDQLLNQELLLQAQRTPAQSLPTVMPSLAPGKIYPPTQPMVFNHGNPNAPPIYPCGMCHKEVHDNDQAVFCESGCNFWFHRVCTGITEPGYQMLTAEVYAEWVCDRCLSTKNIPVIKLKP